MSTGKGQGLTVPSIERLPERKNPRIRNRSATVGTVGFTVAPLMIGALWLSQNADCS